MIRRSFAEVDAQARAHERLGVLRHAAEHGRRVDAALAAGRISAETATATKQHVTALAQEIATGLHLDGHDSLETRRTVYRALVADGMLK